MSKEAVTKRPVTPGGSPRRFKFDLSRWATAPTLVWTALFFTAPLVFMLVVSTWKRNRGQLIPEWTLANYEKIFSKSYLIDGLLNSVVVSVTTAVVSALIAYPLAYVLAYQVPKRWQRFLLILAVLPFWTSYLVRSYAWSVVLGDNGIINSLLMTVAIIDEPIQLNYRRAATVLGFVHFFTMLLTLTIYANLVQIKPSYRLAAADLGASPLKTFLRVTLPLSVPGIMVGVFITFVICMGDFITPQILGGSQELLLPQAIILQIQRAADFPMASAMSVLLMLTVTVGYFAMARWLRLDRV